MTPAYIWTYTHIQCTHDGKDMVSEIAQCHFPVHYLLDGAVRRGMNDRSASIYVCVCACKHAFVFVWPCDSSWNERIYFLSCLFTYSTVCLLACLACENVTAQWSVHKSARLHVCYYTEDMPHQCVDRTKNQCTQKPHYKMSKEASLWSQDNTRWDDAKTKQFFKPYLNTGWRLKLLFSTVLNMPH